MFNIHQFEFYLVKIILIMWKFLVEIQTDFKCMLHCSVVQIEEYFFASSSLRFVLYM